MMTDWMDQVERAEGEAILDLSALARVDSGMVGEIETLADRADARSVKLVLRGVNLDVYKVLKVLKLTHRFEFVG